MGIACNRYDLDSVHRGLGGGWPYKLRYFALSTVEAYTGAAKINNVSIFTRNSGDAEQGLQWFAPN